MSKPKMFQILVAFCLLFNHICFCLEEGEEESRFFFNFIFSAEGRKILQCLGSFGFSYSLTTDMASKLAAQEKLCNCTGSAIKST
uniref:Venom protein n=1 Tax=Hottentotta judaicus TaxID=6863 RepID=F8THJ5_HOTJU|nr:venom protein [Hottentotta judaicus]